MSSYDPPHAPLTLLRRFVLHLRVESLAQLSFGNGGVGMRFSEQAHGVCMGGTAASLAPAALPGAWVGSDF